MKRGSKRGSGVPGTRCEYCGYLLTASKSIKRGFGERCGIANGRLDPRKGYRPGGRPRLRAPRPAWGLSRDRVRALVACPVCLAGVGEHCRKSAGRLRAVNHPERTDLAAQLLKGSRAAS